MSVLPLVFWPDARLSQVCELVNGADMAQLAQDMLDTMYDAPGRGLAGPQVGVMQRIFVMDCGTKEGDKTPEVFIDPQITAQATTMEVADEGCLSIPDLMVPVARPISISVTWQDVQGLRQSRDFDGFEARCIQHEIDHLDGRVTLDHLAPDARATLLTGYQTP